MPPDKRLLETLKDRLSRHREINLSVTGRKSGRTISQPVWFVWDDDKVYLLPVRGRIHSGIRTCSKIHQFGSTRVAQMLNFRSFLLPIKQGYVCGREIPRQVWRQ